MNEIRNDLFGFAAAPAPRRRRANNKKAIRKWREEHRILTFHEPDVDPPWTALGPGLDMDDVAERGVVLEQEGEMVYGATEQQACEILARNQAITVTWPP